MLILCDAVCAFRGGRDNKEKEQEKEEEKEGGGGYNNASTW